MPGSLPGKWIEAIDSETASHFVNPEAGLQRLSYINNNQQILLEAREAEVVEWDGENGNQPTKLMFKDEFVQKSVAEYTFKLSNGDAAIIATDAAGPAKIKLVDKNKITIDGHPMLRRD